MNSGFSRYHINWNNTTAVSKCLKARRILENVLLTWIDDTVSSSDYVASNGRVWKTTTSWPNLWHYPGNFSEGVKKSRKTSMRTVGVPAEIRIGYFPNTSQSAIPFELICFVILEKKKLLKNLHEHLETSIQNNITKSVSKGRNLNSNNCKCKQCYKGSYNFHIDKLQHKLHCSVRQFIFI